MPRRLLLLWALPLACTPAAMPPVNLPGQPPPPPTSSAATPALPIRVLHHGMARGSWPVEGTLRLEGIDRRTRTAFVFTAPAKGLGERRAVALDDGTATPLVPASTLAALELQSAELVERTTIPFGRNVGYSNRAATREFFVWEQSDQLHLLPRGGGDDEVITPTIRAAYSPVFDPSGATLAFTGALERAVIPKGRFYRAVYYLYLLDRPFVGRQPRRIDTLTFPTAPVFGKTGAIYAVARDTDHDGPYETSDHGGCLHRVQPRDGADVTVLCVSDLTNVDFMVAPRGDDGILFGEEGTGPAKQVVARWVQLPEGTVRSTTTLPRTSSPSLGVGAGPSDEGLLIDTSWSVTVHDLRNGAHAELPPDGWHYFAPIGWRDGHSAWALRVRPDTPELEIVLIDARAVLR